MDEDDAITESLFKGLDAPDSPIAFLVGSKKFLEGWSSWRVSTMGLLKVGQNAGAQVLQLFGRGVRLKGWQFSLRRSTTLAGDHPGCLSLLETLADRWRPGEARDAEAAACRADGSAGLYRHRPAGDTGYVDRNAIQ